jgi:hypothetical protein
MKYLLNRKLFELFDKKVRNDSLFDKFLNPYLNSSLITANSLAPSSVSNGDPGGGGAGSNRRVDRRRATHNLLLK